MSLIEKALNKASKEIKSPSSEDGQISIDPTNIVSPPAHPRRSIWMLLVSGLLLLSVVMVSIFLFVSPQSRPPHSKDVTTQVTSLESSPAPLAKDSSGHAETPSAKLLATSPAKENENQEQAPKEAYNPSLPSPSSQESQPVFQQLVRAGIAVGTRGIGGGYRLARPRTAITVLDVVTVFEPLRPLGRDLLHARAEGPALPRTAPLQKLFDEVDEVVRATIGSVTLDTLAR